MTRKYDVRITSPVPAVSIAVFKGDTVLLAKRGKGQLKGIWSLPGGHIEPGEKASAAARRELKEETGVTARQVKHLACHDVILRDGSGLLTAHYVLNVYYGKWKSGRARAASDSTDVRWVPTEFLTQYTLTPGAKNLILKARSRILN